MRRTLATAIVTAVCGGLAGGLIAVLVDSDPAASGSVGASAPTGQAASGEAVDERVGDLAAEAQEIEATLAPAR